MTNERHAANPGRRYIDRPHPDFIQGEQPDADLGDRLVAPFGLTSARWQILGAITFAERPQPVAWLARDLGANRQNVQRIVNDLHKEGLVVFQPNPHHRRAQLVVLTLKGQRAYDAAVQAYYPKADALAEGLSEADIKTAHRVLAALKQRLEAENNG